MKARRGDVALLVAGLAIQLALSFHIRLRAWPETLVPAYLVSKGWHLYREVKFAHAPLWIAIESIVATLFGISPATLRVLALLPAMAAHAGVWYAGRRLGWGMPARLAASLLFVATFYLWDGNAVYPDVAIAALAIPAWSCLRDGSPRSIARAGALLGTAVAIKQPAFLAVAAAATWIAFERPKVLVRFLVVASVPFASCAAVYALAGSGRDFVLWTVIVPLRDYGGRTGLPINVAQVPWVVLGFLPLLLVALLPGSGDHPRGRSFPALLVLLSVGFAAMAFPKFELVHLIPCVSLLALAAGSVVETSLRVGGMVRWASVIPAVVIALDSLFLLTDTSTGEISFWSGLRNDRIVRELAIRPPGPLYLYGPDQNIFIRSGRFPPGRLYANPDLWYQFRAEDLERRQVEILRAHPETILISSGAGGVPTGDVGTTLAAWVSARSPATPARPPRSPGRP